MNKSKAYVVVKGGVGEGYVVEGEKVFTRYLDACDYAYQLASSCGIPREGNGSYSNEVDYVKVLTLDLW